MGSKKRKLILGAWVTVLSLIFLTTSTFAWMSIANSVRVSDLELNVVTENAMEIALDVDGNPGEWTTVLSLGDLIGPDTALKPATWWAERDSFYTVQYGLDGRPGNLTELQVKSINSGIQTPNAAEAEAAGDSGYLIALDLWLRTGASQAMVYLSEPAEQTTDVLGAGTWVIGEPTWNAGLVRHENGGNGAENVVRMGFRSYDEEYDAGGFTLYEPNALENETPTSGVSGKALEGDGRLIRQAVTTWTEQDPVLRGSVDYTIGQFFEKDTTLFLLSEGQPRKFTLYIWLEGQDSNCDNTISGGKLLANIQFGATTELNLEDIYRPNGD